MKSITYEEALKLKEKIFVDVRTPLEFSLDHIDGAINIPVLSNVQRALVGTIYKNESQKKALDIGVSFFSEKLPEITNQLRQYEGKTVIAYCWRGGMRSKAFTAFFKALDFNILQLEGGYKTFRQYVKEELYNFDIKPKIYCIYGMTGTGKTELIQKLAPLSIDLEGLANHRSSIFGHVGLSPRSQKMFENLLLSELRRVNDMPYCFFEGESRKIGNIIIPDIIFKKIISGTAINVYADMSFRVKRIVTEYFDNSDKIREVKNVLESHVLLNKLGKKNVDFLKECLNKGDYEELVVVLLEKYYDPMYKHSQKMLESVVEISSENIDSAVDEIFRYIKGESPKSI